MDDFMSRTYSVQDQVDRSLAPVLARYDDQLARQQAVVDRYRFFSPALLAQQALSDVAGTGAARYRHFRQVVADFHAEWQGFFIPRIFQQQLLTATDYQRLPRYAFPEEDPRAVAARVLVALVGLGVPLLGLTLLAAAGLRRFQVAGG
jgi:ABC-2 type transport system permease protein